MIKLYHWLAHIFTRKHRCMAQCLTPDALAALQKEAAFLRAQHGVEVVVLAENEVAARPRAAGAEPPPPPHPHPPLS